MARASFYGRAHRNKQTITTEDLRHRLSITLDHEVEVLERQFARNGVSWVRGAARFIDDPLHIAGECGKPANSASQRNASSSRSARNHTARRTFRSMATPSPSARRNLDPGRLPPHAAEHVGGSVIGIRYATIFSALDVKVTVIDPAERILSFVRPRAAWTSLSTSCATRASACAWKAGQARGRRTGRLPDRSTDVVRQIWSEMVLFAAGRKGATDARA
ncbi:MAG: hypothetical protein R3C46_12760 [Hyphomonadaceae bacterium]